MPNHKLSINKLKKLTPTNKKQRKTKHKTPKNPQNTKQKTAGQNSGVGQPGSPREVRAIPPLNPSSLPSL